MTHSPPYDDADDAASRLDQVTDDATDDCTAWLVSQMQKGGDPDELLVELLANGWPRGDAESMVEQARRRTRGARSVLGGRNAAARAAAPDDRPQRVIYAPDHGSAFLGNVVLAIGRCVEWVIGREARRVRGRIAAGRCYRCDADVRGLADDEQCPACGSPVVRRPI